MLKSHNWGMSRLTVMGEVDSTKGLEVQYDRLYLISLMASLVWPPAYRASVLFAPAKLKAGASCMAFW